MKILKFASLLIYILLAINFLLEFVPVFIDYIHVSFGGIDAWYAIRNIFFNFWSQFSFVLVSIVILANYNSMSKMNIDRNFLILYVISGIVFGAKNFWPAGWLGLVCVGLIIYMLIKNKFNFEIRPTPDPAKIMMVISAVFLIHWLYMLTFVGKPAMEQYLMFCLSGLPLWVMEEVIIRGMIWMSLDALGWRPSWIVIIQALIFWAIHVPYVLSDPFLFWLQIPVISIFLGILVWRYKSITPSALFHILFNLR